MITFKIMSTIFTDYEHFKNTAPNTLIALMERFTYKNPDYITNEKYGYSNHNVPEHLYTFDHNNKVIRFGRGCLNDIKAIFDKIGETEYKFHDATLLLPEVDYPWNKTIYREDQKEFINAILQHKSGNFLANPSMGKSLSTLGAIQLSKQPSLIIVHTEFLAKQWISEATNPKTFNMPHHLLGGCGGPWRGKERVGQLNICLYHSLQDPKFLKMFLDKVGFVVIDEAQKGSINMVQKCFKHFPAHYRIGVTANVKRRDGKEFLVYDAVGQVKFKARNVETDTRIDAHVNIIRTSIKDTEYEFDLNYAALISRLALDEDRNRIILNRAWAKLQQGNQVLIFVERKAQAFILASALIKKGINVGLLLGPVNDKDFYGLKNSLALSLAKQYDDKAEYERIKKLSVTREIQLLIGTQKAEVGLSIRTLNHAIITTPVAKTVEQVRDRLVQMIGRVERTYGDELEAKFGKKPTPTVDILIDEKIKGMSKQIGILKTYFRGRVSEIKVKEKTS